MIITICLKYFLLNRCKSLDKLAIQLLQKLEEQTLYIIQLEERISELEKNK